MKVTLYGAAREVTGSCYLFETDDCRFLVDCGMFQGGRESREHNRQDFDFDPGSIDFVLLTHAHIDHSGLLPKLVKDGYEGQIFSTRATVGLLGVMLPDSAHIQESEAERAQRYRKKRQERRKHRDEQTSEADEKNDIGPIYTMEDAEACLKQLRPFKYDQDLNPHRNVRCRFRDAGHILGSAILEIWVTENGTTTKIVMSGDLGEPDRPILRDPTFLEEADILFVESTYGDREHKDHPETMDEFVEIIHNTLDVKGGNLIVPAFAVGRTQELLYHLFDLTFEGKLKNLNIFVDSPMATEATRVTMKHFDIFDEESKRLNEWRAQGKGLPRLKFTSSLEDSMELNHITSGAIIISASGMCNAGRIKHHLRHNISRPECSIMITGYQAQGTLGRRIVDGDETVKIFGKEYDVLASIHTLGGFSAHAGQSCLLKWTGAFKQAPNKTFVVHGEESAAIAFADRLRSDRGWEVHVPTAGQAISLT
jgi:metallo-beta-lactamase family protein